MRRCGLLLLISAVVALQSADAGQSVWSGLVIASNAAKPVEIPAELNQIETTLKETFGYNQFTIIGEARKTLSSGDENWLASSKYFSLHIDSKGTTPNGYLLNLQLYKERELLLETEAKLGKRSPLVIKGPLVGDGQLLLVLLVQ
jgi:hypothetical protein